MATPLASLPPGWEAVQDVQTGHMYYWSRATGVTQWEPPEAVQVLHSQTELQSAQPTGATERLPPVAEDFADSGATPAPAMGPHSLSTVSPAAYPSPALEIWREDVAEFDSVLHSAASPKSRRPQRNRAVDVYVQNGRNPSNFRSVPSDRAKRVYGFSAAELSPDDRGSSHREARKQRESARSPTEMHSIGAFNATMLDPCTAELATSVDPVDLDIFDLIARAETWRLNINGIFLGCQTLLAGLCLIVAWLAQTVKDGRLTEALCALEPFLSGLTLALAQTALVGGILRILSIHEAMLPMTVVSVTDPLSAERAARRAAWGRATLPTICTLANAGVVATCLLGARSTAALLEAYEDGGAVVHQTPFNATATSGYVAAASYWSVAMRHSQWHEGAARIRLGIRAFFGLFAAFPALLEVQQLMSPRLPGSLPAAAQTPAASLAAALRTSDALETKTQEASLSRSIP
mmetsp:Transcript_115245/g.325668  ORF Transcript_115245/g.325668 Transcript_115245/m.325668 type:complete len:464 (+) Transcript_115245:141-1532(+)